MPFPPECGTAPPLVWRAGWMAPAPALSLHEELKELFGVPPFGLQFGLPMELLVDAVLIDAVLIRLAVLPGGVSGADWW